MTKTEYQKSRLTLGLSVPEWIDKLGIKESSHKSYNSGRRHIPRYISAHIKTLIKYESLSL